MIAVRATATPRRLLYRIGRLPDPLAWPPHDSVGAGRFDASGMADLDVGAIVSSDRNLTQAIAGWAHDNELQGVVYPSRLDSTLTCRALFEGTIVEPVPPISRISPDDPDLRAVAELFGLVV